MYRKYPKVRYISMIAKEMYLYVSLCTVSNSILMYLDVSWCIMMYMNVMSLSIEGL